MIEMKATEQYFPVVLFIMLYKVVLTFGSLSVTIQMQATIKIQIKFGFWLLVIDLSLYGDKRVKMSLWMKSLRVTIQIKATEQYIPVHLMLFVSPYSAQCNCIFSFLVLILATYHV